MKKHTEPRVYTIEPGQPFLATLAKALCDGDLIAGFAHDGDPLSLAKVTIYVPTRRAARELRSAFLDHLGAQSALLPVIKQLGEFDEEEALFSGHADAALGLAEPIDSLHRQLLLGGLIADWNKHLTDALRNLYPDEDILTPASTADAFWMAKALAELLDQLQTEDLEFEAIETAAAELDLPGWWNVTHAFLQIIASEWPQKLDELRRIDPAIHRNMMLRGEAARLTEQQPSDPVIVAGSTGTIPATADLIAAISKLPSGAVVLPGYDLSMSQETKAALEDADDLASAIGHPQYGMHHLVLKMGAQGLVSKIGDTSGVNLLERQKWIGAALEPAPRTATWLETRENLADSAFDNVEILTADNERQEAAAIAAALREAIADPSVNAALVTPHRTLARRVVTELARYGIEADDSGGSAFDTTPQGVLLGFAFQCVFNAGDPAELLALLKNPLVQLGMPRDEYQASLGWLEQMVLRGGIGRFTCGDFVAFATDQINARKKEGAYEPSWLRKLDEDQRADIEAGIISLAARIEAAFAPLCILVKQGEEVTLETMLAATITTVESLAKDEGEYHQQLFTGEAGTMLRKLLTSFFGSELEIKFAPDQWPEIVRAVTSTMSVKPVANGHPRVSIWGTLEARLQTVDFLIMGGLNEAVWPQQTSNDPFLTRGMKIRMKMQPPERRIGLSAHDFYMGMGQKRVLLTRAIRMDNAPAVASRWLQRLETLAGEGAVKQMQSRGQVYVDIVQALEKAKDIDLETRPEPKPPVHARPTHFSVTEIERLRRDPYAIYAKRVLGLQPLEDLVREPDAATRGTLFHAILEESTKAKIDYTKPDAADQLRKIADRIFADFALPADIEVLWRTRFDAAISAIADWEKTRDEEGVKRHAELKSQKLPVDMTGVTLRGVADRLDLNADGSVDIIDFKTGGVPSVDQVHSMLAPQMPLEAALLKRGAFDQLGKSDAAALLYVTLGPKGDVKHNDVRGTGNKHKEADVLADAAWEKLVQLLSFFADEESGYVSRAIPAKQHDYSGEYDHLARVLEWSAGVDSDNGSEST
ncbi:double-strand break repair protein AddB [Ahrensia kielensis]|uniref:double-strand break repair protein AddB n=1 Tax=Ahrensia kielensis TaxID=76980 RepID=UPI00036B420C|nr:double-strand break repair protein AddB [Ahrensia kielensis]